jgi:hypothetical protein
VADKGVLALLSFAIFVLISVSEWNPVFAFIGIVIAVIFLRFGRGRRHRRHGGGTYYGWDDDSDSGGWFGGDGGWGNGGGDGGGNGGGGD